jgi:hypothetical protein
MESLRFFSSAPAELSLSGTTLTIGNATHTLADPDTVSQNTTAIASKSSVSLSGNTLTIDGTGHTLADPDTVSQNTTAIASKSSVSISGNTLTIDGTGHTLADPAKDDVSFSSSTLRSKIQGVWEQIGHINTGMSHEILSEISFNSSGDILAFGSHNHNGNSIVKVYEYQSNNWTQKGSDIVDSSHQYLSKTVSLSADGLTLLTTIPNANSNAGIAKIYKFDSGWTQLGNTITGVDANDYLGRRASLSKSGKRVLLTASSKTQVFGKNMEMIFLMALQVVMMKQLKFQVTLLQLLFMVKFKFTNMTRQIGYKWVVLFHTMRMTYH